MQYVFDEQGRRYLDAYSNVCHIGHCHPHVVAAVQKAMSTVVTNTRYLHPTITQYAARLKSKFSPELDTVFFVNSGSEANDLAVRLARVYTKKHSVIAIQHAYHGTTAVCTGLSTSLAPGTVEGCVDWKYCSRDVHVAPMPDLLRGPFRRDEPLAAEQYAQAVKDIIETQCPGDLAAFIHESVIGVGGQVVLPEGYLKSVYEKVRRAGGLCIADEVQVGFGRSGTSFWAFESQGVVPDIVTMGKPIGNGFPLAAVVVRRAIAEAFDDCQYFNTAGGNPVSCAAGLAVLDVIEAEGLQENARRQSELCMTLLRGLQRKHPRICDVRGLGLFIGVELAKAPGSLEPAPESAAWVFERCRQLGVLIGKGGPHNNVLRIKPPVCLTAGDVEFLVACLDRALGEEEEAEAERQSSPLPGKRLHSTAFPPIPGPDPLQCNGQNGHLPPPKRLSTDGPSADSPGASPEDLRQPPPAPLAGAFPVVAVSPSPSERR
eukprot:EG_transcript_5109